MLFSMFFGAGNLIFPPLLGAHAGTHFWPAMIGFLIAAVALPVLAVIAIAITGTNLRDLSAQGGKTFAVLYSAVVYLSIGAFYALPRTGAVSFDVAVTPLTGWTGLLPSFLFNICFFGLTLALSLNPNGLIDKLGKWLTPALLILLLVLIVMALSTMSHHSFAPAPKFTAAPISTGLLEGYFTMDAVAGLAFGIVVVAGLRERAAGALRPAVRGTMAAGVIAGALLGVIYAGLGYLGQLVDNPTSYTSGATLLSDVAASTMGTGGKVVFGLIVLLACLTTSVGLTAASAEFFSALVPKLQYKWLCVAFAVISCLLATMGLSTVLAVAGPIIGFIYPPALTLIVVTIVQHLAHRPLPTFARWAVVVSVVMSAMDSVGQLGVSAVAALLRSLPAGTLGLAWILPTLLAGVVGYILKDMKRGTKASRAAAETNEAE